MVKAIMDRVFIRLDKKTASDGGILLPETVVNERTTGVVESVGEEVSSVKPGDRVLFHIFDDLPTFDPEVVVVRENSLLGIFENE
jgi:co-chaperonin GroES (HSP10)